MEIKKYKVFNNNNFSVGINFENEHNKAYTITKNNFYYLTEDELYYVNAASKLFQDGILFIDDQEMNEQLGIFEKNPNTVSKQEIEEILKLSVTKMKKELEKIDKKHAIDKVIDVAKKADLPTSKLKVIKELYNIDIFEEVDEEIV